MTGPDTNWQTVSKFMSDLKNASRLATYVDTVVSVFESNAWRRYTDANGRSDDWLECEFDYFLSPAAQATPTCRGCCRGTGPGVLILPARWRAPSRQSAVTWSRRQPLGSRRLDCR